MRLSKPRPGPPRGRLGAAGRGTNLALLALVPLALATGVLAFAVGSGWARWVVVAHGVAGFAILGLSPWKSVVIHRGVRRRRPGRSASMALTGLVAVATATGILHSTGLAVSVAGITLMQVHVASALCSLPFAAWHVMARRVRPRITDLSRRTFLRSGIVVGGAALGYGGVQGLLRLTGLPGGDRRFTGSYEAGSFDPDSMPVTEWLDDSVPAVDPESWALRVEAGAMGGTYRYSGLSAFDDRVRAVIDCTGGWFAEQEWEGVRLDRLLPGWEQARSIEVHSVTGYSRRFPAADAPSLLLALRAGRRPLAAGHGFPARVVAPGRRGFWWVKWVDAVELSSTPWWWQPPFPLT